MQGTGRTVLFHHKRVVIVLLVVLGVSLVVYVTRRVQLLDEDQPLLVFSRSQAEAESLRKSAELQLVGYVTCRRQYGIFNPKRQSVKAAEAGQTVLCRNGQYFVAGGMLDSYLRTLLREEDYPLLAQGPAELRKLQAASDYQALHEAADDLVRNKDW